MSPDLQLTSQGLSGAAWTRRYSAAVMNTFGAPQRVLVRGEGCHVWDADGNRYLDLLAGIAVNALGHAHPFLISAVTAQLATIGHVSNFFATAPQVALAERLLDLIAAPQGSRVFSPTPGRRPTRRRSSWPAAPAGPGWSLHGARSTAAPWAPWR